MTGFFSFIPAPADITVFDVALLIALVLLTASVAMVSVRLLRGPHAADRVVALDMLGLVAVALAGGAALTVRHPAFLDVGLAVALISFLATVAFALFLERASEAVGPDEAESGE